MSQLIRIYARTCARVKRSIIPAITPLLWSQEKIAAICSLEVAEIQVILHGGTISSPLPPYGGCVVDATMYFQVPPKALDQGNLKFDLVTNQHPGQPVIGSTSVELSDLQNGDVRLDKIPQDLLSSLAKGTWKIDCNISLLGAKETALPRMFWPERVPQY